MFGLDKKKPTDFQGGRTSDAIISGCMKAANSLVKDRKAGKKGSSSSSGGAKKEAKETKEPKEQKRPKPKPSSGGSGSKRKADVSDVVTLTADNFKELVIESDEHWMVEVSHV